MFTSKPLGDNVNSVASEYRKMVKKNFIENIQVAAKGLSLNLSSLIEKIETIEPHYKFSPHLFQLYAKLRSSMKQQDVEKVTSVVTILKNIHSQDLVTRDIKISSVFSDLWDSEFLNDKKYNNSENVVYQILPIDNTTDYISETNRALITIRELYKDLYIEIIAHLTDIKLFKSSNFIGTSSSEAFGSIFLSYPDEHIHSFLLENIVHEASHLHLDVLMSFDKIIENRFEGKFKSPVRKDLRPMYGVFHATFVLSRMVEIMQRMQKKYPSDYNSSRLSQLKKELKEGIMTVKKHAILTINGKKIVASLSENI